MGRNRLQPQIEYSESRNLTGKGNYTKKKKKKVADQPLIKLIGRLTDKSNKIIYIHNKQVRDTQNKNVFLPIAYSVQYCVINSSLKI